MFQVSSIVKDLLLIRIPYGLVFFLYKCASRSKMFCQLSQKNNVLEMFAKLFEKGWRRFQVLVNFYTIYSALNIFASSLVECDFFFPRKVLAASRKLWVICPDSYLWDVLKVSLKRNLKAQALLRKSFKRKVLPIFENRAEKKSKNENKTMSVKIEIKVTFLCSSAIGTDRVNVLQQNTVILDCFEM